MKIASLIAVAGVLGSTGVAQARPAVLVAPAGVSAGSAGSVWADAGDAARTCEVRLSRGRIVQGPYRARIGAPIVVARWRVPAGARTATWRVALRCASTRAGLRRASALVIRTVHVRGKSSGRLRLAEGGVHLSARSRDEIGGAREPATRRCANADNGYRSKRDANGFCTGYSSAYVASRRPDLDFKDFGTAANWYKEAVRRAWVGGIPKAGAVAWWAPTKRNPTGHVAFVERVDGDKVFISEADRYAWNKVTTRTLPADGPQPTLYILGDQAPPQSLQPTWTSTDSPAAVQRANGDIDVVAIAPGGSLSFYANTAGTRTWAGTLLAPAPEEKYGPVALLAGDKLVIGATNLAGAVGLWIQEGPTVGFTTRAVTGKSVGWDRGPALVARADGTTDVILTSGPGWMALYRESNGAYGYSVSSIGQPGASNGSPVAVARPDGGTDVVVIGVDGSLAVYASEDTGSTPPGGGPGIRWNRTEIAGPYSATGRPAMLRRASGETDVAAIAPDGTLTLYVNAAGTSTWTAQQIAGPGAGSGAPAILARPDGGTDVVAVAPDGSLAMYSSNPLVWQRFPIARAGSAVGSPAAVRRPDGKVGVVAVGPDAGMTLYSSTADTTVWDALAVKP